ALAVHILKVDELGDAGVHEDVVASADTDKREPECLDQVGDVSEPQVAGAASRRLERPPGTHEPNCIDASCQQRSGLFCLSCDRMSQPAARFDSLNSQFKT